MVNVNQCQFIELMYDIYGTYIFLPIPEIDLNKNDGCIKVLIENNLKSRFITIIQVYTLFFFIFLIDLK